MPYLYGPFSRKRALCLVALLREMTCNLRHPISLRHPVPHVHVLSYATSTTCTSILYYQTIQFKYETYNPDMYSVGDGTSTAHRYVSPRRRYHIYTLYTIGIHYPTTNKKNLVICNVGDGTSTTRARASLRHGIGAQFVLDFV